MDTQTIYCRYQDLQRYAAWSNDDAVRITAVADGLQPALPELVEDFYAEIERHPEARKVITGGSEQIVRLKQTLIGWLQELLAGPYDAEYAARRWRVGYRHAEIGLDPIYTNLALSRVRIGLHHQLEHLVETGRVAASDSLAVVRSLDKLLDLDLALMQHAYEREHDLRRQEVDKLATIGQVAGGVAHELRNPLNVIKTSVYYLSHAKHASQDKQAEHLRRIEKQVGMADGVITALSNFAKLPVPNLQNVPIEPWIRQVLTTVNLAGNVEVTVEESAKLHAVWMDPEQMSIVVRNLMRNAGDAMPEGGRLTIRSREAEGHVFVEVADTGHGIAVEDIDRIMEPLFTTKARGIGLGLAMAKAIVEKNQGRLSVASEPGKGATFTVRLASAGTEESPS